MGGKSMRREEWEVSLGGGRSGRSVYEERGEKGKSMRREEWEVSL